MRALTDGDDGRLGRADEAHDLRILELGVIAQQPENGIWPILTARNRRVAGPALGLDLRYLDLRLGELQSMGGIFLGRGNLLARELPRGDRVHSFDTVGDVAVGNALHLEHVQTAEFGDLLEGERGVVDQPYGGRFWHQRGTVHWRPQGDNGPLPPLRRKRKTEINEGE